MLEAPREQNSGVGSSYCGNLGRTIVGCPKIDESARQVASGRQGCLGNQPESNNPCSCWQPGVDMVEAGNGGFQNDVKKKASFAKSTQSMLVVMSIIMEALQHRDR
jgi:hypothetical protein